LGEVHIGTWGNRSGRARGLWFWAYGVAVLVALMPGAAWAAGEGASEIG
jgi:hypothetical protein